MRCIEKIRLTIKGCIHSVENGEGNVTQKFDLADAVLDAGIIAGLGFFGSLVGVSLAGTDLAQACLAAGISAGFQFFTVLALKRGLVTKE